MPTRIRFRRDTAANFAAANPVLDPAEPAVETDTGYLKIGDGETDWSDLPYQARADTVSSALAAQAVQVAATYSTLAQALLGWGYAQSFRLVSATRDANEAITTGSVIWPDGATGTFTTDTASTAFPGAIDAYHVTHVLAGTTLTVTQPAVTRDAGGAVTAQPALTVA